MHQECIRSVQELPMAPLKVASQRCSPLGIALGIALGMALVMALGIALGMALVMALGIALEIVPGDSPWG